VTTPPGQDQLNWWPERGGIPVTVNNGGAGGGLLATGIGLIICITASNPNASVAMRYTLRDGIDNTGPVLAYIACPVGYGDDITPAPPGIYFGQGLFLQDQAGGGAISITYLPLLYPLK